MTTTKRVQLRRDPFARTTLYREKAPDHASMECAWCGSPSRFVYYWEHDGILPRAPINLKPFCSASCFREFYR
jgi:hypothetical protein